MTDKTDKTVRTLDEADRALRRRAALAERLGAEYDHAQGRTTDREYGAVLERTAATLGEEFCEALAQYLTRVHASPQDMHRTASNPTDVGVLLALVDGLVVNPAADTSLRESYPTLPPVAQALLDEQPPRAEPRAAALTHRMGEDLLDDCGTALSGEPLHVTPVESKVTCPACITTSTPPTPAALMRPEEQVAAVRDALTLCAEGDLTRDQTLRLIEHVTGWQR